eukprot:jgi/Botrbrau1/5043/Bobra.37_1s0009.1
MRHPYDVMTSHMAMGAPPHCRDSDPPRPRTDVMITVTFLVSRESATAAMSSSTSDLYPELPRDDITSFVQLICGEEDIDAEGFIEAHVYDEKDIEDTSTGGGSSSNDETRPRQDDVALPTWPDRHGLIGLRDFLEYSCFIMMPLLYSKLPLVCQQAPLEALSLESKSDNKKTHTLILDLDQTLVHSIKIKNGNTNVSDMLQYEPNHVVPLDLEELKRLGELEESRTDINRLETYIWYRPGLERFMQRAAELFEIVIFSAGRPFHVNAILSHIPNRPCITRVFTENHTTVFSLGRKSQKEFRVKDISSIFGGEHPRLPGNVIVVDDLVKYFCKHLDNVVPIVPFRGDPDDKELDWLLSVLEELKDAADVRDDLRKMFNLKGYVEQNIRDAFKESYNQEKSRWSKNL